VAISGIACDVSDTWKNKIPCHLQSNSGNYSMLRLFWSCSCGPLCRPFREGRTIALFDPRPRIKRALPRHASVGVAKVAAASAHTACELTLVKSPRGLLGKNKNKAGRLAGCQAVIRGRRQRHMRALLLVLTPTPYSRMFSALLFYCLSVACVSGCSSNLECSLNGVCNAGFCDCNAGWRGATCGELSLYPIPRGSGYNKTGSTPSTSSWGGKIVRDPTDPSLHHLFLAEFTGNCGLDYWSPMSRIIRAESRAGFLGPYEFAAEVESTFSHNPQVVYSAAERKWLMFRMQSRCL